MSLDSLAGFVNFSPFHFLRIFRETTGVTPARFLAALRMAEARRLLLRSELTVTDVSRRIGYASVGTFVSRFTDLAGLSPGRFRQLMRSLVEHPMSAVLPLVGSRSVGGAGHTPSVIADLDGSSSGSRALVVGGLLLDGGITGRRGTWVVTATGRPVCLPDPASGRERVLLVLIVPDRARLVDALVEDADDTRGENAPSSSRIGVARLRPRPERTAERLDLTVTVRIRPVGPTDPPVLAIAPLRWLAETASRLPPLDTRVVV